MPQSNPTFRFQCGATGVRSTVRQGIPHAVEQAERISTSLTIKIQKASNSAHTASLGARIYVASAKMGIERGEIGTSGEVCFRG